MNSFAINRSQSDNTSTKVVSPKPFRKNTIISSEIATEIFEGVETINRPSSIASPSRIISPISRAAVERSPSNCSIEDELMSLRSESNASKHKNPFARFEDFEDLADTIPNRSSNPLASSFDENDF